MLAILSITLLISFKKESAANGPFPRAFAAAGPIDCIGPPGDRV